MEDEVQLRNLAKRFITFYNACKLSSSKLLPKRKKNNRYPEQRELKCNYVVSPSIGTASLKYSGDTSSNNFLVNVCSCCSQYTDETYEICDERHKNNRQTKGETYRYFNPMKNQETTPPPTPPVRETCCTNDMRLLRPDMDRTRSKCKVLRQDNNCGGALQCRCVPQSQQPKNQINGRQPKYCVNYPPGQSRACQYDPPVTATANSSGFSQRTPSSECCLCENQEIDFYDSGGDGRCRCPPSQLDPTKPASPYKPPCCLCKKQQQIQQLPQQQNLQQQQFPKQPQQFPQQQQFQQQPQQFPQQNQQFLPQQQFQPQQQQFQQQQHQLPQQQHQFPQQQQFPLQQQFPQHQQQFPQQKQFPQQQNPHQHQQQLPYQQFPQQQQYPPLIQQFPQAKHQQQMQQYPQQPNQIQEFPQPQIKEFRQEIQEYKEEIQEFPQQHPLLNISPMQSKQSNLALAHLPTSSYESSKKLRCCKCEPARTNNTNNIHQEINPPPPIDGMRIPTKCCCYALNQQHLQRTGRNGNVGREGGGVCDNLSLNSLEMKNVLLNDSPDCKPLYQQPGQHKLFPVSVPSTPQIRKLCSHCTKLLSVQLNNAPNLNNDRNFNKAPNLNKSPNVNNYTSNFNNYPPSNDMKKRTSSMYYGQTSIYLDSNKCCKPKCSLDPLCVPCRAPNDPPCKPPRCCDQPAPCMPAAPCRPPPCRPPTVCGDRPLPVAVCCPSGDQFVGLNPATQAEVKALLKKIDRTLTNEADIHFKNLHCIIDTLGRQAGEINELRIYVKSAMKDKPAPTCEKIAKRIRKNDKDKERSEARRLEKMSAAKAGGYAARAGGGQQQNSGCCKCGDKTRLG